MNVLNNHKPISKFCSRAAAASLQRHQHKFNSRCASLYRRHFNMLTQVFTPRTRNATESLRIILNLGGVEQFLELLL